MAEEQNTQGLGGFSAISNFLTGNGLEGGLEGEGAANLNDPPIVDPDAIVGDTLETTEPIVDPDEVTGGATTTESDEGDEPIVEPTDPSTKSTGDTIEDLSEFEEDVTKYLNEEFSKRLGWELSKEDSPNSIEEFIDFMNEIVSEASKPSYANDEMEELNKFVENGGSLKDFYKSVADSKVDVNSVDIEDAFTQKQIIKEHYQNLGYKEDKINRLIKRNEEAGTLEEEASDSLELLKEYNANKREALLDQQEKQAVLQKEEQQKFVSNVESSIKELGKDLDVKLTPKEEKELKDYILVADDNGITQFQKEMLGDVKKFVSSALYTKKGGSLLTQKKKQGETTAVKNLHNKLKANKGNPGRTSGGQQSSSASDGLSILSSMLKN